MLRKRTRRRLDRHVHFFVRRIALGIECFRVGHSPPIQRTMTVSAVGAIFFRFSAQDGSRITRCQRAQRRRAGRLQKITS